MRRAALVVALLLAACGGGGGSGAPEQSALTSTSVAGTGTRPATSATSPGPGPRSAATLLAAGDIASCNSTGDEATAALLDSIPGTVFAAGDLVYPSATPDVLARCYDPRWGRHKARTIPVAGNHEYKAGSAAGYFDYFGSAAHAPGGYSSFDLGSWHVVVLNSNCPQVGGCGASAPQVRWLRADLAASSALCTVALMHHPRFSSGAHHGSSTRMTAFWNALHDYGVEVVVSGHDHLYERFAPQRPDGSADPTGVRQFVVGTGGKDLSSFATSLPNSEVRDNSTLGVLQLALHPTSYDWKFVPVAGQSFTDSGATACSDRRPR